MKTIKISEATPTQLDWLVAQIEGVDYLAKTAWDGIGNEYAPHRYSTDWSQGGPIIERERVTVANEDDLWTAYFRDKLFESDGSDHFSEGPTPLIAAMRCYCVSKLGEDVEVPDKLI